MARSGVGTALAVVLLFAAAFVPSGRLALICAASACVVFVRMRCGRNWAVGCYAASAALALVLLPEKGVPVLYALFLGYYPIVKLETERITKKAVRWLVRAGIFNFAFFILYFLFRQLFAVTVAAMGGLPLIIAAANAGFVLYDYALTQLILIYLRKIDGRI